MSTSRFAAAAAALSIALAWSATVRSQSPAPALPALPARPAVPRPAVPARPASPAPPALPVSPAPVFVGARTCATCHQEQFDTWKGGRHSKMLQPANRNTVLGNFGAEEVVLQG